MPTLWTIRLAHPVRGAASGPVRSVPANYAGVLCAETGELVAPDRGAIRACLPACYRAAWGRAGGTLWFGPDGAPAYAVLHDRKGRPVNTVYAEAYLFRPGSPPDARRQADG